MSSNNPVTRSTFNGSSMDAIKRENSINVWVFNMSSGAKGRISDAEIIFTVENGNTTSLVRVPKSWAPINIGLQAPKDALFASSNFLNSVTKNVLRPITNAEAEKFFNDRGDEAIEEYDLVISRLNRGNSMADFDNDDIETTKPFDLSKINAEDMAPAGVTPMVLSIIGRLNAESPDITEPEAYSAIRNIEGKLTKPDLEFIIAHTKAPRLQQLANKLRSGIK